MSCQHQIQHFQPLSQSVAIRKFAPILQIARIPKGTIFNPITNLLKMQHSTLQHRPTAIGTSIVEPKPQKEVNDYWARYATAPDAREMENLMREVFPNQNLPPSFAREIRRDDVAHILAVRKLTRAEMAAKANEPKGILPTLGGRIADLVPFWPGSGQNASREDETIAGMVSVWVVLDQAHITAIATNPRERRRGVGGLLMVLAINEAIDRGAEVATLEVRKSNQSAQALYKRFGFTETGIRHRYYADNNEDALIMSTPNMYLPAFRRLFQRQVDEHTKINGVTAFVS